MTTRILVSVGALAALAMALGCGSSDSTGGGSPASGGAGGAATGGTGGGDTGGTAGSATGGAAGSATGGTGGGDTGGSAGSATGGSAGSATGGSAGSATGGTGGGSSFWTDAYDASGSPSPASGKHRAGDDCMDCHDGGAPAWLFGGTIFLPGGGGAAHVQVGVKDANGLYTAYSATNGNFWYPKGSNTVDWAHAEIRARNGNGEIIMSSAGTAACNSCHTGSAQLVAP